VDGKYRGDEHCCIKGGLGLLAVANILLQFCNATALCDIPGWTIVGMFRVYRVWRGLSVDAVRIETEFEAMHDERKYRIQHVHNLHNDLDQKCECANDRDDQIELGKTANIKSESGPA